MRSFGSSNTLIKMMHDFIDFETLTRLSFRRFIDEARRKTRMKHGVVKAILMGLILIPCTLMAQVPAGAPAGTTGKCKDGSFTTAPKRQGACRGHKGIDTWYANDSAPTSAAPATAAPATPKPATSAPGSSASASKAPAPAKTAAAGGGPGLVWVNTASNVYHCYGAQYYGTTKAGKYMSEADAKAAGARPDHGKACSQQ